MLKNFFNTAVRNLWRNKTFSLINIFGLAIGISASLVIYLIVQYDFNFDTFHKDGDRIYRVVSNFNFAGEDFFNSGVTSPMGNTLRKEATGLELVVPLRTVDEDTKVTVPASAIRQSIVYKKQKNIVFADEAYFRMITYSWLAGSRKTALQQPYQVVLTASRAKQYFPNLDATEIIGNEIYLDDTIRVNISGIVKDIPQHTDFSFGVFVSRATLENTQLKPEDWDQWNNTNSASQLLVKLSPGIAVATTEKAMLALYDKYRRKDKDDKGKTAFMLQPLREIHFNAVYNNLGDQRLAHKPTLYGLLAVASFLLLLGCINFINLTTAQASQRAKEIGIRKTMGSSKTQLIAQFLSETFCITAIATLLSIAITPLLLKVFADFIPEGLHFNLSTQPGIVLFLCALVLVVTLLSGFYPAIILSAFKPVLVLKNQAYSNTGKTRSVVFRKTLTVSQFVIAQVFIIATLLVTKQISYSLNKDLGFKKDAIIYFSTDYRDRNASHKNILMEKLKAIPEIAMISLSSSPPTSNNTWSSTMSYKDGKKEIESDVQMKMIDSSYLALFNMKLVAGTALANSDTDTGIIINQTYAGILGFREPQQAVGKNIEFNGQQLPVVGVAADFHQKSLHEIIKPLAMVNARRQSRVFSIALQPQNASGTVWKSAIAKMEKAWREIYPDNEFEYKFLDETIAKYYTSEKHISSLLLWATGLAISISCLGLLGLVIYITSQRTKEIGIRKVIGASIPQLITLLSKDFLKLIVIAFLIAAPVAWWGAHKWLQNFAYKTSVSGWVFVSGGLIMFLLAFIILGMRTFKAASVNPVKSLRSE
ncbi:MAG: ABC transporter permease [Chitinophagaceae bacterium]